MRYARSLIAAVIVATSLVVGAGPVTASDRTGSGVDRSATLRYLGPVPPARFDPARSVNAGDDGYMYFVYDRLVQVDATGNLQPMLATSWKFADDGSSLEMKLRKGVKFQDGTSFDAAAVKANIDRYRGLAGTTAAAKLASVTSVETPDDMTVRFDLAPGLGADLPANLATNAGMMVAPAGLNDPDLATKPGLFGSGPYTLQELKVNESATLARSPVKYWDKKAGRADQVVITYLPLSADRLKAVQAGSADVAFLVGAQDIATGSSLDGQGFQMHITPVGSLFTISFRSDRPDVSSPELREALSAALDRKAITTALTGLCSTASQPYPKGSIYYEPKIDKLFKQKADLAAAKRLLQQSGVTDPTVDLTFATGGSAQAVATIVQQAWTDLGVSVNATPRPAASANQAFFSGEVDALSIGISVSASPSGTFATYYTTPGSYQLVPNDDLAAFKAQADKAADPALSLDDQAKIYRSLFLEAAENMWYIPICGANLPLFASSSVTGLKDMPWTIQGIPDFRYVAIKK